MKRIPQNQRQRVHSGPLSNKEIRNFQKSDKYYQKKAKIVEQVRGVDDTANEKRFQNLDKKYNEKQDDHSRFRERK